MKFSLLFALIIPTKIMAQHYDPGVMTILEQLPAITTPQLFCHEFSKIELYYKKNGENKDLQNCALALCGPSRDNPTALITDMNFSNFAPKEALARIEKIAPTIKAVIEKDRADKISRLNEFKKAIESNRIADTDFSKLDLETRRDLFAKIFDPIVELSIRHDRGMKERIELSYTFPTWADENFKQVARNYAESYRYNYLNKFNFFQSKGIYSDEEMRILLAEKIKDSEDYLEKNPGTEYEKYFRNKIAESKIKLEKKQPLVISDFEVDAAPRTIPTPSMNIACETGACAKALKDYLTKQITKEQIEKLIADQSDNAQFNRELNKCKAGLISNSIRGGNQKTAEAQFKEAMKAIKKNVMPMFSTHSRTIIEKSLDQIRINVSRPAVMSSSSESKFVSDSKEYLKNAKAPLISGNTNKLMTKLLDSSMGKIAVDESPCDKLVSANIWDATEPDKKTIYVSDYACSHDMRGQQIIAHEIGHNINYLFSKLEISKESLKTYLDTRSCITGHYPKKAKINDGRFKNDKTQSEEDMADFITNMAYVDNPDFFSCALLRPDITTNDYVGLQLMPEGMEVHSQGLYRVIMESLYKNKPTPVSCRTAMDDESSQLDFNTCSK